MADEFSRVDAHWWKVLAVVCVVIAVMVVAIMAVVMLLFGGHLSVK